jgi:hypothetical protein
MSKWQLWRDWVIANCVGELLGLGLATGATLMLVRSSGPSIPPAFTALTILSAVVVFGLCEGAVVGYAQWLVLRRRLQIERGSWVGVTSLAAVAAWLLGMLPNTIVKLSATIANTEPLPEPGPVRMLLLSAGLGIVGGLILASCQSLILWRYSRRAPWWLLANAAAWAVGMPIIFFAAGLPTATTPLVYVIILGLTTFGVTGAVVGAIHGLVLVFIVEPAEKTRGEEIDRIAA